MNPPHPSYENYDYTHMPKMEQPAQEAPSSYYHGHTAGNRDLPRIGAWYNPRGWTTRTRIIVAIVAVVVLIAIIVGAYEGVKLNRYPDYSPLNYSLKDTFQGANFFDNFDYFTGADPAEGFVV